MKMSLRSVIRKISYPFFSSADNLLRLIVMGLESFSVSSVFWASTYALSTATAVIFFSLVKLKSTSYLPAWRPNSEHLLLNSDRNSFIEKCSELYSSLPLAWQLPQKRWQSRYLSILSLLSKSATCLEAPSAAWPMPDSNCKALTPSWQARTRSVLRSNSMHIVLSGLGGASLKSSVLSTMTNSRS